MAIINVKTKPEAPTKQPATIRAVFDKSTPAKAAAMPDNEFNNDITTGISPPPIGNTKANPANNEAIKKAIKTICINSKSITKISAELNTTCPIAIKTKKQININNHLEILLTRLLDPFRVSDSLKKATKLPENVTPPIKTVI